MEINNKEFMASVALASSVDDTKAALLHTMARQNGGPRDKKFRESVLTLVVLLQQLAVKSEVLPNEGLELMQSQVDRVIAGTRQVMASEGVEIPGPACRERLLQYPDRQIGAMYEHGKTEPFTGRIPAGYREAFRSTVGDVQTFYLATIGAERVTR